VSRLYDTLRRMEKEKQRPGNAASEPDEPVELLNNILATPAKVSNGPSARINLGEASRLVALTDPQSLGAEKFRALVARLESLREKRELKSLQITSAVIKEGKSLVAANLAITLAKHFGYKVLLVEGDLHRPTLTTLLGCHTTFTHWMICHCGFLAQARRATSHRKFCNRPDLPNRLCDWLATSTGW
jgi:hypothetical protein